MADRAARLLLVEDDHALAAGLVAGLRARDFEVDLFTTGAEVVTRIRKKLGPEGARIVERAARRIEFLAGRKRIALEFAVPEVAVLVHGDPIAIEQAVGNVVENAVVHGMERGHVAVGL